MRVISGEYKGRKLVSPSDSEIRPTVDRVKESLFNILQNDVKDSVVCDLFSGSGALGIEALSRGAKKVYFCDIDVESLRLTERNLSFVDKDRYEIIKGDFFDCIGILARRKSKFDIIIADPPYKELFGDKIIDEVFYNNLLANNGLLTIEHKTSDPTLNGRLLKINKIKKYGDCSITFLQQVSKVAITGTFDPFTLGHKDLVNYASERFDEVYIVMLNNPNKSAQYSVESRLEMINKSLSDVSKRCEVSYYDGMTVDFCRENGIKYILRGVRDEVDFAYEKEMADFNYANGGIKTLLMPGVRNYVSSTAVRNKVSGGEGVQQYVDSSIIEIL